MADQIGGHGGGHGCRIGAKTGMNPVGRGDRNYPPYPIGAPTVWAEASQARKLGQRDLLGVLCFEVVAYEPDRVVFFA